MQYFFRKVQQFRMTYNWRDSTWLTYILHMQWCYQNRRDSILYPYFPTLMTSTTTNRGFSVGACDDFSFHLCVILCAVNSGHVIIYVIFLSYFPLKRFTLAFLRKHTYARVRGCDYRASSSAARTAQSEQKVNVTEHIWSSPRVKRTSPRSKIVFGRLIDSTMTM